MLKGAISDSIPTSCNNQHLLRLSCLVRMIEIVLIANLQADKTTHEVTTNLYILGLNEIGKYRS